MTGTPEVADAAQDGVALFVRRNDAEGALAAVAAVVVDPGFAEDLPAEAAGEFLVPAAPGPFGKLLVLEFVVVEGMVAVRMPMTGRPEFT